MLTAFPIAVIVSLLAMSIEGEEPAAPAPLPIETWLVAGPESLALPASSGVKAAGLETLLDDDPFLIADAAPAANDTFVTAAGARLRWTEAPHVFLPSQTSYQRALAFTWIRVDRYTKAKLVLHTGHAARVFLDGASITRKAGPDAQDATAPSELSADLSLAPGAHRLLILSVFDPSGPDDWQVAGELRVDGKSAAAQVRLAATGRAPLSAAQLLDTEAVSAIHLSPYGRHLAIEYRTPEVPSANTERWIQVVDSQTGKVVHTTRGVGNPSDFEWHPDGESFRYTEYRNGTATVWLAELGGASRPILAEVARLGSVRFAPDGRSIFYSRSEESNDSSDGIKRMRGLTDRWPGQRTRWHLYQASIEDHGMRRRLTSGEQTVSLLDVAPDGSRLLYDTTEYGLTERPFSRTHLFELDLTTLVAREVLSSSTLNGVHYAPDGERLLIEAGQSFYDERGGGGDVVPNDYDEQLFLVDRNGGDVVPLTAHFAPSVSSADWSVVDGAIYLTAQDGLQIGLFRLDPATQRFSRLETGVDAVERTSIARRAPLLAYVGSGAAMPPRVMTVDLDPDGATEVVARPGDEVWSRVDLGLVERFDFVSSTGTPIVGRVHLPSDFDREKRYPAIVFYYGGTAPTSMTFGGRYPLELWAAHGYVVYNLVPSGATGLGAEFARRHVNDWSRTTAPEILEGVDRFLAEYPQVDKDRLGCIGASYGGFMTLRLITLTDRFACAVSHAGISSISSYWGEGHWGYLYSAVATADRYPWSDRDLYVGESPLFHADSIHTPLLLSHGTADTNVPIGESEQLYTALRTLGREVEFIQIEGENHHILTYPKRKRWMELIVAWFDKHLKEQPEWWDAMWEGK